MTGLHAEALATLTAWTPPTDAQAELRKAYAAHLHAHADGVWRHGVPDHLTASAVVLDAAGEHTLLTLHAKAQLWFQLGGHCEPGDATLASAALREATEESGLPASALRVDPVPVQLSPHPVSFCRPPGLADGDVVQHLDVRFLVVADRSSAPVVSEESLDVRWWPVDSLPDPEPALVEAVRLARLRLTGAAPTQTAAPSMAQSTAQSAASSTSSPGGGSTLAAADQPSR